MLRSWLPHVLCIGLRADVGLPPFHFAVLKNLSTSVITSTLNLTLQPVLKHGTKTIAKMNAASTGLENMDLDRLNDKDKADLRQFLANEQQRSQIQSRTFFSLPRCSRDYRGLNPFEGLHD